MVCLWGTTYHFSNWIEGWWLLCTILKFTLFPEYVSIAQRLGTKYLLGLRIGGLIVVLAKHETFVTFVLAVRVVQVKLLSGYDFSTRE